MGSIPVALLLVLATGAFAAGDGVLLADPQVTLGLNIRVVTESLDGEVKVSNGDKTQSASISMIRSRSFRRSHQDDPAGGKVVYQVLADRVKTSASGQVSEHPSKLDGLVLEAVKGGDGKWLFSARNGNLQGDAVEEIGLLEAFENRRWLPGRVVKVGESWPFVPGFIQESMRRDLSGARASGVMKLIAIRILEDGTRQAEIDCAIAGAGREEAGPDDVAAARLSLTGKMLVNIDRPGTIICHLNGRMATGMRSGTTEKLADMPVSLKLTISPMGK